MTDRCSVWHEEKYQATVKTATAALGAMMVDDNEGVSTNLSALNTLDQAGAPGMPGAVALWSDLLLDHMFAGIQPPKVGVLGTSMIRQDGTEYVLGSARADTEVPKEFLWAGQIIAARVALDRARFEKLWDEAPSDDFGSYVLAVLVTCARTMLVMKRGYALEHAVFKHSPDCKHGKPDEGEP